MKYDYQIILLEPDMTRGERINIGIIAYKGDKADIRMPVAMPKLRAIDPAFTPLAIEKAKKTMTELAAADIDLFKDVSRTLGALHTSELGWFTAKDSVEYELKVNALLSKLVFAPKRPVKRGAVSSRMAVSIRSTFKKSGFMGEDISDIDKHKIIQSFPISEQENLKADFAYKNGVYHVTTIADLRAKSASLTDKQGRGALKALTMLEGKKKLGGKAYAVYAATQSQEREVQPVITMLNEYADGNIYNFLSDSDMTSYYDIVAGHLGNQVSI